MAYVPPHKRLSKTQDGPPPTPAQLLPKFKSFNLHSSKHSSDSRTGNSFSRGNYIVYARHSISRWLAVQLMDDVQVASALCLVPVCLESMERRTGEKPLTLANGHSQQEHHDIKSCSLEHTWVSVTETVHGDLLSAFQNIRNELLDQNLEEIKPSIVARFGKVLFHRNHSHNLDYIKENLVSESYIRDLRRMFYTNVPQEYIEYIKSAIVPELGVQLEQEKELFFVKLADAKRPDSIISCKCRVQKDENKLELYKIELNPVRHVVEDISCLVSNVDLRLALCTKRIFVALQDEEEQNIRDLVSSATLDPNVKGGLRWPLGKANSGGQYSVVGIWHTKTEAYSSSLYRLKLREADRFDFRTSTGEVTRDTVMKLGGITRNLLEQRSDAADIMAMLEDVLKLIRNQFLAWDGSLVSSDES